MLSRSLTGSKIRIDLEKQQQNSNPGLQNLTKKISL